MKLKLSVLTLFLLISTLGNTETINTGNILTNSTFGTGTTYSTDGWTVDEHTHGHHGTGGFSYLGGGNNPGGSVAAEEDTEIKQTVTLSEKTNMTVQEMQNGWSSTIGADIWYWNQYDNTTTLKQTITGSDGSVSTQQRVIQDTGCGSINCGSFTNYTDTHVQGSNTQTDFDIEVSVTNTNNRTGHWGPDIDDVTLGISYTHIPPIDTDTQEIIDDVDEDITDIIDDIPEDFDWYNDDIVFDDTYTWEEEEYTWNDEYTWEEDFYFEEELETIDFDIVDFEELPMFEEFETFEEMPIMIEETFFEENYILEPPPMEMMEEIFTEEFEEDFTNFLEETGMEEEFMEFLEDEGITAEEFFEEITEEEFNDEPTTESFEEFEEPMEEVATNEESTPEVIENEEETMGEPVESNEPIEEETEIASNESTNESTEEPQEDLQEEESDSEGTEESEVSTEEDGEQEDIQSEDRELDTDDRVITDVAKVETKLKQNLKKIAKQIAKVTKETTQNLSKEDLFFKNNSLDAYKDIAFYSAKEIYDNTSMGLFLQIDLSSYSGEIYAGTSLSSYTDNDSIEIHRVKLLNINKEKRRLQAELEALKQ